MFAGRSLARLILEINIRERLTVVIADDEAGVLLLDGPRRREAAWGHFSFAVLCKSRHD